MVRDEGIAVDLSSGKRGLNCLTFSLNIPHRDNQRKPFIS